MLVNSNHSLVFGMDAVNGPGQDIGHEHVDAVGLHGHAVRAGAAVGRLVHVAGRREIAKRPLRSFRVQRHQAMDLVGNQQRAVGQHDAVLGAYQGAIGREQRHLFIGLSQGLGGIPQGEDEESKTDSTHGGVPFESGWLPGARLQTVSVRPPSGVSVVPVM
jgi:hypothetical protein